MIASSKPLYEIRSLAPATGYRAVYTREANGRVELELMPFDFVGVAEMQVLRNGRWLNRGSEIVGVQLTDGHFDVVTNCQNFHGIVKEGATWAECINLLPTELQSRVVKLHESYSSESE